MTIYTSKKNGKSYTMQALENGKFELTNTEDASEVITTTESVIKRWYKKSVVVNFETAEPKPAEQPKARKTRKARKPSTRTTDEPVETIELTLAEAESYFHGFVIDTEAGKVRSGVFHPRKITALAEGIIEFTRRHTIYRVSTAC